MVSRLLFKGLVSELKAFLIGLVSGWHIERKLTVNTGKLTIKIATLGS